MESLLSANEDILIPPLSLNLKPGASYITGRRSATIFSSVNSAAPNGVQTIKFNIASAVEWCDPASAIISFDVVNDSTTAALHPATVGAHCLFERYQARISAAQIEDIEHYGRTCEAFTRLIPAEKRLNEAMLGFGTNMAMASNANVVTGSPFIGGAHVVKEIAHVAAGNTSRKKVYMKLPLSGIFTANQKYLPCWSMGAGGIEVLLSLCPAADAMVKTVGGTAKSQSYHLEDIRLECDMISIDSALQEQYSRNLLEGGSLTLHTKLWDCTQVYLPPANAGAFTVSLSKALSRAATIFFNFSEELTTAQIEAGTMYANTFRAYAAADETLESHVTVGSKRFPEYAVRGLTAHFWKLVSALGVAKSLPHSVNVDVDSFKTNTFMMGTDLEACPMVASSGINTTGGQELALQVKNFKGATANDVDVLRRCWACIHYEAIVELRATGAHLLT